MSGASIDLLDAPHDGVNGVPLREELDELTATCRRAGVATSVLYAPGRPWVEISRRVAHGDNDLVVVAKRSELSQPREVRNDIVKLVGNCPCPVWMVHPDGEFSGRRVLVATGLDTLGLHVTQLGATVADLAGAELHVLHAWQMSFEDHLTKNRLPREVLKQRRAIIDEELRKQMLAAIDDDIKIEPKLHVVQSSPKQAIRNFVSRLRADVLVVGTGSHPGRRGAALGKTAKQIMNTVDCSLLMVRPEGSTVPRRRALPVGGLG